MKPPKFGGAFLKKRKQKKTHVTKLEYRRTSAKRVDGSLDHFFKARGVFK